MAPKVAEHWSLTILPKKLLKIGAKAVVDCLFNTLQLAEMTGSRDLVSAISAGVRLAAATAHSSLKGRRENHWEVAGKG